MYLLQIRYKNSFFRRVVQELLLVNYYCFFSSRLTKFYQPTILSYHYNWGGPSYVRVISLILFSFLPPPHLIKYKNISLMSLLRRQVVVVVVVVYFIMCMYCVFFVLTIFLHPHEKPTLFCSKSPCTVQRTPPSLSNDDTSQCSPLGLQSDYIYYIWSNSQINIWQKEKHSFTGFNPTQFSPFVINYD